MVDAKKVANNILDFLIDPTNIPVKQRVYFRPEETLKNDIYEQGKADSCEAYKDQKHNSDFYPQKNRSIKNNKEATMDRRSLVASFDILSKNFNEKDPFSVQLRTMALAMSKMSEEEVNSRVLNTTQDIEGMVVEAKKKMEMFSCPKCGTKVLEQTGYCLKCKKKVKPADKKAHCGMCGKDGDDEEADKKVEEKEAPKMDEVEAGDVWSKEASDLVTRALLADLVDEDKEEEKEEEKEAAKKEEEEEKEEVEAAKKEEEKEEVEAAKKEEVKEEKKEEEMKDEKEAAKKEEEKEEEKEAAKKEEEKEEEKESSEVNSDILASISFGDIEIPVGCLTAEDMGELSAAEKEKLAKLF